MPKISTRDARAISFAARGRETFTTHGALIGRETNGRWDTGRLPSRYIDSFLSADYAISSYATPIAWHIPEFGWVMPDERYTVTTTRHQSTVRYALSMAMVRPVEKVA